MNEGFGALAKKVNGAIASPWALVVALVLVIAYFVFGPALGFLITLSTFVLVFLIEHESYRDNSATQVKLDEIIAALNADRSKIGIEDRPPKEIDSVRDATRAREGERKTG